MPLYKLLSGGQARWKRRRSYSSSTQTWTILLPKLMHFLTEGYLPTGKNLTYFWLPNIFTEKRLLKWIPKSLVSICLRNRLICTGCTNGKNYNLRYYGNFDLGSSTLIGLLQLCSLFLYETLLQIVISVPIELSLNWFGHFVPLALISQIRFLRVMIQSELCHVALASRVPDPKSPHTCSFLRVLIFNKGQAGLIPTIRVEKKP